MKHRDVPYHGNPTDTYCALACYTMIGQYLIPDAGITFEMFGKLADSKPGYVVWAFPIWKWLMDHGIHIEDQDISDIGLWGSEGVEGLRKTVGKKEFAYYKNNTYNLEAVTRQLGLVTDHPKFSYIQKKVSWNDIVEEFNKPGICDLTLDGKYLSHKPGFSVHRVVLLDISGGEVIFHNPRVDSKGAYQRESIKHFKRSVENLSGAEVCRYWL